MKYTTGTDNALPTCSSSSSSSPKALNELQSGATTTQQQQQQQQQQSQLLEQHQQSSTTTTSAVSTTAAASANPNPIANSNSSNSNNPTTATTTTESSVSGETPQATTTTTTTNALFSEQVTTVTNLFEKWNDCERTVAMYALLKRLPYASLKFLQYSIDSNLTQNLGTCQTNLSSVVIDINANNPAYLQNLLSTYKTSQPSDVAEGMSSSSSDKDSMPCYGSDFQLTSSSSGNTNPTHPTSDARKEDILHEVLNMLPLLKPGNEEAKTSYMTLIPLAVKDTVQQQVPTELVQQIFSYMLIHPAIGSDDRRSLNVWLRHLEDYIQASKRSSNNSNSSSYFVQPEQLHLQLGIGLSTGTISDSSSSSSSSLGNLTRSVDWQTIAPPSRHHSKQLPRQPGEWRGSVSGSCGSINPLCDNLNGITLNELASSQNSLGLSLGSNSSLVNGVVAGAAAGSMLGLAGSEDHDTSFSKNGTEILDFEPSSSDSAIAGSSADVSSIASCSHSQSQASSHAPPIHSQLLQPPPPPPPPQLPYASILMGHVGDQFGDINRWSLDSKIAALKTRRSNSLTTQTISSCSSNSSNSSVITVNDNCSNSTENLAQFANKPRSFSLSIEHHRNNNNHSLANSTSDTRLDDFKPSYIKFQTRNVGMSGIGLWLKSLRLHKYIELFKNMTYEEMLLITEEFLQSVGVTKGASHKLALCIEKLKERSNILAKVEQELHTGQMKISTAVEELTNIVLTPMKPLESTPGEDNIGLRFLKVIDLVSNALQQDPYCAQDDDTLTVFMWILDRSIHNEAFVNHANQLKELKFKLSKIKMSMVPKLHHVKTTGTTAGNMNKPRWNGKSRKCDPKNASSDRINHRKNSNDMLNFSLSCLQHPLQQHHQQQQQQLQQQQQQQQQQQMPPQQFDYNGGYQTQQYKSSSYPSFMNNPQQQQVPNHHSQHAQQMQQMLQQHAQHFPALPQQTPPPHHRRSLNNLIVVAGGPQQPQQLIFKPGQGVLTNNNNDSLQQQQQQQQQRKPSLNGLSALNGASTVEQQQPKKTMAAVVMVSSADQAESAQQQPPQIIINNNCNNSALSTSNNNNNNNNNNNILNNNLINQQQLQLLAAAAAAAAVGNSSCLCPVDGSGDVVACSGICSTSLCQQPNNNNNNNMDHCLSLSMASLKDTFNMPPHDYKMNDYKSLEQLETLCRQMTEQAMN